MKLWISRSANGDLQLHSDKPLFLDECGCWTSFFTDGEDYTIDYKLLPEVTFETSPQQVEIKLIEDKESSNE